MCIMGLAQGNIQVDTLLCGKEHGILGALHETSIDGIRSPTISGGIINSGIEQNWEYY